MDDYESESSDTSIESCLNDEPTRDRSAQSSGRKSYPRASDRHAELRNGLYRRNAKSGAEAATYGKAFRVPARDDMSMAQASQAVLLERIRDLERQGETWLSERASLSADLASARRAAASQLEQWRGELEAAEARRSAEASEARVGVERARAEAGEERERLQERLRESEDAREKARAEAEAARKEAGNAAEQARDRQSAARDLARHAEVLQSALAKSRRSEAEARRLYERARDSHEVAVEKLKIQLAEAEEALGEERAAKRRSAMQPPRLEPALTSAMSSPVRGRPSHARRQAEDSSPPPSGSGGSSRGRASPARPLARSGGLFPPLAGATQDLWALVVECEALFLAPPSSGAEEERLVWGDDGGAGDDGLGRAVCFPADGAGAAGALAALCRKLHRLKAAVGSRQDEEAEEEREDQTLDAGAAGDGRAALAPAARASALSAALARAAAAEALARARDVRCRELRAALGEALGAAEAEEGRLASACREALSALRGSAGALPAALEALREAAAALQTGAERGREAERARSELGCGSLADAGTAPSPPIRALLQALLPLARAGGALRAAEEERAQAAALMKNVERALAEESGPAAGVSPAPPSDLPAMLRRLAGRVLEVLERLRAERAQAQATARSQRDAMASARAEVEALQKLRGSSGEAASACARARRRVEALEAERRELKVLLDEASERRGLSVSQAGDWSRLRDDLEALVGAAEATQRDASRAVAEARREGAARARELEQRIWTLRRELRTREGRGAAPGWEDEALPQGREEVGLREEWKETDLREEWSRPASMAGRKPVSSPPLPAASARSRAGSERRRSPLDEREVFVEGAADSQDRLAAGPDQGSDIFAEISERFAPFGASSAPSKMRAGAKEGGLEEAEIPAHYA